jgi:hypothetical protein
MLELLCRFSITAFFGSDTPQNLSKLLRWLRQFFFWHKREQNS